MPRGLKTIGTRQRGIVALSGTNIQTSGQQEKRIKKNNDFTVAVSVHMDFFTSVIPLQSGHGLYPCTNWVGLGGMTVTPF